MALLFTGVILLASSFIRNGIYYMPIQEMQRAEESPETHIATDLPIASGWGEEIVRGNLFDPYRAEPPKIPEGTAPAGVSEPPPPIPEEKPAPQIELNGIILNQYGEHIAYLKINNAPPMAVRKGDRVEGIRVLDVTERVVELSWENNPISLTIEKIKNVKHKTDIQR